MLWRVVTGGPTRVGHGLNTDRAGGEFHLHGGVFSGRVAGSIGGFEKKIEVEVEFEISPPSGAGGGSRRSRGMSVCVCVGGVARCSRRSVCKCIRARPARQVLSDAGLRFY